MNIFQPSIFWKKVSFWDCTCSSPLPKQKVYLQKKHAQPAQDQRNLVQQLAAKTRRLPAESNRKKTRHRWRPSYSGTLLPSASGLGEDQKTSKKAPEVEHPMVTTGILGEETDAYIRFP